MNLDESRDERGGQKGNVWTRAGAREKKRERFRSVIHTSLFSFCLSPFEGLSSFSPFFMSGWDEKHNHQHFRTCEPQPSRFFYGPELWISRICYRSGGGVLSDRIGIRSILWAFRVLVLFVGSTSDPSESCTSSDFDRDRHRGIILAHPP
jgi:hypothetical protein